MFVSLQKQHSWVGRWVQTSDPRCRGSRVSALLTRAGLPWPNEKHTCNQSLLFVWSGDKNQSNGPPCKSPIYTDLDEEAVLFWGHRGLVHVSELFMDTVKKVLLLLSRICFSYGSQCCDFRFILVLGQNWPTCVNVLHREKKCDGFYLHPKTANKWPVIQMAAQLPLRKREVR